MTSWQLLAHLVPFWESNAETPVFRREAALPPVWQQAPVSWVRALALILAVCGLVFMLAVVRRSQPIASLCVAAGLSLIALLAPSLLVWALPLGVTLAPVVVGERERGTWDMLRATPLPVETILLGKARGAMWRLRYGFTALRGVLLAVSVIAGFISLGLLEHTTWLHGADLPGGLICGGAVVVIAVGALLFLIDRAQQFVLMAVSALAVSASVESGRLALPGAIAAALVTWLADTGLGILLLALMPRASALALQTRLAALVMLGPTANVLADLPLPQAALGVAMTLIGREIAVRLVWRWTVHTAGL